ncbi:MAG: DsbC family protein [Marinagarivorans sp.]|nr:DsbC family protein [Marinagarivorans sp.]
MKLSGKNILGASIVMAGFSFGTVMAVQADEALDKVRATISAAWQEAKPGIEVSAIEATEMPGIFKVSVGPSSNVYSTADGKNFIVGDLYRVRPNQITNVTEESRNGDRAKAVASVADKDMVIFPAKGEKKARIYVFTDVDCYYCQKLHHNMAQMNEMGIEIAYLGYPRAGIGSDSYKKVASAWCSDDKRTALTKLKNREEIPVNVCAGNPIDAQYNLGQEIGLSGTPALILESGELIAGFLEPDALAGRIGLK